MMNINAMCEESAVLTSQDGTYSKHCALRDEYMFPIRVYASMISDSVCCCIQSTTFDIYHKNLKHNLSKFYTTIK
jgi:D-arabinose 1-dehydrogenase-like Zn-dependent alcohol dehydrogenase